MQHDARRNSGHATLPCGFLDREPPQLDIFDQSSLPVGQTLQQAVQIGAQRTLLGIFGREESVGVLEGNVVRALAAAQVVDQLVAGERVCPGCERKRPVVALALQMHGKECLLDEILDFSGGPADASGEVSTQVAAEDAEELTMRARIPLQAANHQWPEALFG